jgi:hypothetical protein
MSVAQTLPNIPSNLPLWQMINQQSENPEYSLEAMQIRITSAQLLALKTTPVQLIAPPVYRCYGLMLLNLNIILILQHIH